jgi:hypothetical protein
MKKQALIIVAMLSLLATLTVISASAQSAKLMRVTIPFAFTIGKTTFPAGKYNVERSNAPNVFALCSPDWRTSASFLAQSVQAKGTRAQARLEFRRYGNQYFLARVWMQGHDIGRELSPSRRERELANGSAKHLTRNASEPEIVYIAAQ